MTSSGMYDGMFASESSVQEFIAILSGDSIPALVVCQEILEYGDYVEPNRGGVSVLGLLYSLNICEHRIYKLWNDVSKKHVGNMIAMLRACQFQFDSIDEDMLDYAIDNNGAGIDIEAVLEEVHIYLPDLYPESACSVFH